MSIVIRGIEFSDADWLVKNEIKAFGAKIAWKLEDYCQVIREGVEAYVISKSHGEPFAVCFGNPMYNRYEILSIFTDPNHLRHGYARRLLEHASYRAAKLGKQKLRLEVWAGNIAAIALYKKLGFVVKKTKRNYYGRGKHAFYMERGPNFPQVLERIKK